MELRPFGRLVAEAKEFIREDSWRIATGFPSIDALLRGGMRPGHVCQLLGRTAVGKTSVAIQIGVNASLQGVPTLFASLEMGRSEVTVRALSAYLDWPMEDVERELRSEEFSEHLLLAQKALTHLTVGDSTKPDWDVLKTVVAAGIPGASGNTRPRFVILDHLKLMRRYGYPRGEAERVQQLAEDAKAFAKETGVALLVIHQVGRSVEGSDKKNHGHVPLSLESGMYGGEQDADVVLGVYRPGRNPELTPDDRKRLERQSFLQVVKNRFGMTNYDGVELVWHLPSMRFQEASSADTPTYLGDLDAT